MTLKVTNPRQTRGNTEAKNKKPAEFREIFNKINGLYFMLAERVSETSHVASWQVSDYLAMP